MNALTSALRKVRARSAPSVADEILFGRDPEYLRIFVSSKMDGSLDAERVAARSVIRGLGSHRSWLWEDDAPVGALHSEQECIGYARTSDGLVLIIGGPLSPIIYAEYESARRAGANRYVFIRDGAQLPQDVEKFIRRQQKGEIVYRYFANTAELKTHLHKSLRVSVVRSSRHTLISRRERYQ